MRAILMLTALLLSRSVWAQAPGETDELLRLGSVATLAPLCGLRAEAWAFDLRRAELQAATRSRRFDDEALRTAPGHGKAEAALGYAEMEALESFAAAPPIITCGPLAADPDLARADDVVAAFRAQRAPGS